MKKITQYLLQHKWGYVLGICSMIIAVSLDMVSPQLTRQIIDDVIVNGEMGKLKYLLLGIMGVGVGRCVFQYIKEFTFDCMGTQIASDIRRELFAHIQSLSANFFDRNNTGELMARVKDDVDRIWDALSYVVMLVLEVAVHTSIILFCMYSLNVRLALIPTVAMAISATVAILMERKLGAIYEEISDQNSQLNTVAEENLAGVRTVKAFAREKFEIGKFLSHNKRYYNLNMKHSKVFVKYYPCFQIITKLLPMIILLLGGRMVMQEEMTLGTLGAFVEYSMNIVWPMEMLGWLSNGISAAFASNKKIKKIFSEKPVIVEVENPTVLDPLQGSITFQDVSFHKEDLHDIVSDLSFHVEAGHTIGIMGATGSGKSSVIYLLQRLYDVTGGSILIDGVDIRKMSLEQLRSSISIVMQDVFLFSDTISENVKLGKRDGLHPKQIQAATRAAQASEFIEAMENQYDTVIGERGIGLSGGQKQRISIARAIAKHTPILVLDDSTSALDMETEHQIQQTLGELKNTTKIIVAHRISAVRKADEIIVMKDGKIEERGTHEMLLSKKGYYYQTYEAQYGDMERGAVYGH